MAVVEPDRAFEITPGEAGRRLDLQLAHTLGVSRRYAARLIQRQLVLVGGRAAAKGEILRAGDRVTVLRFREPAAGPLPRPDLPLVVLAQAGGLVALDKPAGWPTQPLDLSETDTLLNAAVARFPEMVGVGEGAARSGVVHRLDRGTSGVLVLAREQGAWERARRAFAGRSVEKLYLARVHGALRGEREIVQRLAHRGPRMRIVRSGGREAHTHVRSLRIDADTTLVEARPTTGLMHQIRVALASLGHPVLGDHTYGSPLELGRHLLHASSIRIEELEASSATPPELLEVRG